MPSALAPIPEVRFANLYRGSPTLVPFHEHSGTEFVLITRGHCRVNVGEHILEGNPGDLLILPSKIPHDQTGRCETVYADFTVPARRFNEQPRIIAVSLNSWEATLLTQLVELFKEQVPSEVYNGIALALIGQISHRERRKDLHRALHPGLVHALRLMEEDLLQDLTVGDLARVAELSVSHLTALFREHLGCGPMAWRQKQRLEFACRMLRNRHQSIAEVASSCGYPDTNYFARLFRQNYGCSPTSWRQSNA